MSPTPEALARAEAWLKTRWAAATASDSSAVTIDNIAALIDQHAAAVLREIIERWPGQRVPGYPMSVGYNEALADCLRLIRAALEASRA